MNLNNFFKKIKKILLNSLVQILIAFVLASCFYSKIEPDTIRFFLTISVCLRELLVFILPFLLFSFVSVALSSITRNGMFFVFSLMLLVLISNFINVLVSGFIGFSVLSDVHAHKIATTGLAYEPLFSLHLPHILSTTHSLAMGVIVGIWNSFYQNKYVTGTVTFMHDIIMKFMKMFVKWLPFFVGGFLLKLFAEGKMTNFIDDNVIPCSIMCGFLLFYLFIWLIVAAGFKKQKIISIIKNSFPAIVTAFSTMSSAAALPLSLTAAAKNTNDKMLADAVMPLTLNFHMVGDTIIIPIMSMLVMVSFGHSLPTFSNFILFGMFFVLNKFAGGGVPSGTIMVTIPVLKDYLGFDDSMIAFIVAFYGILDPIATAGNVAANNFFIIIFQKIRSIIKKDLC